MTLDELYDRYITPKLAKVNHFDPADKRLNELANYLNEKYQPDIMWGQKLIAGKLCELEELTNVTITREMIDKSLENYFNSNIPYKKDLEYFIVSRKTLDDVEEFSSDLLTFSAM